MPSLNGKSSFPIQSRLSRDWPIDQPIKEEQGGPE